MDRPDLTPHSNLTALVRALEADWPQHLAFTYRHLGARTEDELAFLDDVARRIAALAGDAMPAYIASYKNVCAQYMKAEMTYRRHERYEHREFRSVVESLYDRRPAMHDYMIGLLVSLVFWWQNGGPLMCFRDAFLPAFSEPFLLLEVGPGHGVATSLALDVPSCRGVVGWDISEESLALTRSCLASLGHRDRFDAERADVCEAVRVGEPFDGAAISQVLEIVSDPAAALSRVHAAVRPGGLLYVNAPVDFAAPDHIRRWTSTREVDDLILEAGFEIAQSRAYVPSTLGRSDKAGVSHVVVARRS